MEGTHVLFKFFNSLFQRIRRREGDKTVKPLLLQKLALLAAAGAAGTLGRYALAGFIQQRTDFLFPLGTLFVNIAGCFLAGLCYSILQEKAIFTAQVRIILLIGFFGAFSTFSSYMLETAEMTQSGQWGLALANILLENILGFLFMVTGILAGKFL